MTMVMTGAPVSVLVELFYIQMNGRGVKKSFITGVSEKFDTEKLIYIYFYRSHLQPRGEGMLI